MTEGENSLPYATKELKKSIGRVVRSNCRRVSGESHFTLADLTSIKSNAFEADDPVLILDLVMGVNPIVEVTPNGPTESRRRSRQVFLNGEVHDWYRLVLGYTDQAVSFLIKQLGIQSGQRVLDPFCGTGTTLVECMKQQIFCMGIDANPSSCFAARVKIDWSLQPKTLLNQLPEIKKTSSGYLNSKKILGADPTFQYLKSSGMLKRGWISRGPLQKAIAIKKAIKGLSTTNRYKDALTLALIAEVVEGTSNVKFGPELYCGPAKKDHDVFGAFEERVKTMSSDLRLTSGIKAQAEVRQGDARQLQRSVRMKFDAVITSPPYPAEHDYTRNSRLELAFLEHVLDRDSLRAIKRTMIRCHTKGIYADDVDDTFVTDFDVIQILARRIATRAKQKTHCFAPLYPSVIRHYFGGMKRHLLSLWPLLKPGAQCGYVVGDQAGYLRVHIPTASILADIAESIGFKVVDTLMWRQGVSVNKNKARHEHILILKKPSTAI